MKPIEFTVWGPPQGKLRARTGKGLWYTPKKTQKYQALVRDVYALAARHRASEPHEYAVRLSITAFYPIPKRKPRWWRDQAAQGKIPATAIPDWDNVGKVISDALNGIAWKDDRQVVSGHVDKWYSDEPCVEVTIRFWNAPKQE